MTPALNPTIKAVLASLGSDRAFVRGAGTRLWDAAGRVSRACAGGLHAPRRRAHRRRDPDRSGADRDAVRL